LDAAVDLIARVGPDVTMDDIAAAANVGKPVLYRTIGDKNALVAALSERFVDRLDATVAHAASTSARGRARFEAAVRATLETIDTDRNLFLFVNTGGPGTDSFRRLVDRSAHRMVEQFTASRTAAGLDPLPARTWAHAMVGAVQVIGVMWLRDGDGDLDDVAEHLTTLMWPGLSAATSP
jgi:AcrR family transcriptional regulator